MLKFSTVDIKAALVGFESDAVFYFAAKHHLRAVHEIEHHVLQYWLQGFSVYHVKVDALICGNLDPDVTFDVVDEPSLVQCMVNFPVPSFQKVIICQLEKKNLARAPDDKSFAIDQEHLPKILVINLLKEILSFIFVAPVLNGKHGDSEALSLPIKRINFIILFIIKALEWEVFVIAVN